MDLTGCGWCDGAGRCGPGTTRLLTYTHLAESGIWVDDLPLSVAALLIAEACNVGLTPVVQEGHPALTRSRLGHVGANYLRPETHAAANALLI